MERSSGVLMHVSSLPGLYSCGSFGTAAAELIDLLADCGFSWWQVLPFCMTDEYASPYKSDSAFAGNPFFIDLAQLCREGLITPAEEQAARQKTPWVCEFRRLREERLALLRKAALRAGESSEVSSFIRKNPSLAQACRYLALKKANGALPWQEWTTLTPDPEEERFAQFLQYVFFTQWDKIHRYAAERGVRILGDIPFYVSGQSADVWANRQLFELDAEGRPRRVAGVPPDYFAQKGQFWGNPLYRWDAMREDGFAWWKERLACQLKLFDGVRMDHFRAVEAYWAIPAEAEDARAGEWEKGPGTELISALQSVQGERLIVAEDLGDITPQVRALVEQSGFPGMRVLQFAFLGDRNSPHLPFRYDQNCVAYTGTHDNNTLLGYVWEMEPEARAQLLAYCGYTDSNWDKCYDSVLRTMLESSAGLVIFPVQDLLGFGADTRLNKPGVAEGNWSYRVTKEQLSSIDRAKFRRWNDLYGRTR